MQKLVAQLITDQKMDFRKRALKTAAIETKKIQ